MCCRHLWGATKTVVETQHGPMASGIAWFAVQADATNPSIVKHGYVAANNQSVLFPSIGVNAQGKGVMTFSLTGPDYFPSSAYVKLDATSGVTSSIHIIRESAAPADGFTGYQCFGDTRVERWGDYSAAVPDGRGPPLEAVPLDRLPGRGRSSFRRERARIQLRDRTHRSVGAR